MGLIRAYGGRLESLPQCGRDNRKYAPASVLYRLGCITKYEPLMQLVRDKNDHAGKR